MCVEKGCRPVHRCNPDGISKKVDYARIPGRLRSNAVMIPELDLRYLELIHLGRLDHMFPGNE